MRLYDRRCRMCGQCSVLNTVCRVCGFLHDRPPHPLHPQVTIEDADAPACDPNPSGTDPDERGDATDDIPTDPHEWWLDLGSGG